MIPVAALIVALLLMLAEQRRSVRNEKSLRARGAVEPARDVYPAMAWAYPGAFLAMGFEGWWRDGAGAVVAGAAIFAGAKALKYWAIASLGARWTFRVLVPPGSDLVLSGPYAWLRHPNYVAVIGELVGFAVLVGAPRTGIAAVAAFLWLIRRRIQVEEKALGST